MQFWNGWFQRIKRRHPQPTFLSTLNEIEQFRELVSKQSCLACTQQTLELANYVRNPTGWAAEVSCRNCNFTGVVNSEGFDFKRINSKGKARD